MFLNSGGKDVQSYVAHVLQLGYAPKTIGHIRDVLSAILRTTVKWDHIQEAPARGVDLPALRTVRPKWVLTGEQAESLIFALPLLARTLVGLAILTGTPPGRVVCATLEGRGRARKVPHGHGGGLRRPVWNAEDRKRVSGEFRFTDAHVPPSDAVAATGQTHRCWILGVLDKVKESQFHRTTSCVGLSSLLVRRSGFHVRRGSPSEGRIPPGHMTRAFPTR